MTSAASCGAPARADRDAHRSRRRGRPHRGPRARSRRLRREALQRPRGDRQDPGGAAAHRSRARAGAGRRHRDRRGAPGPRAPRGRAGRRARGPVAQGVRAVAPADARRRDRRHPRAPDRGRLGHELVRLDEDARRPRLGRAAQARGRPAGAALRPHPARGRVPVLLARRSVAVTSASGRRGLSLRATLLAAFAYVLVLVIVALEVPLASNVARRVDSEIKADAFAQAQLIATTANDDLDRPPVLQRLVEGSAPQLGGRVIVVDAKGRLLADSAGPGLQGTSYASRPEIQSSLDGETAQDTRDSSSLDESILFTAVPVIHNRRPEGAVRVTQGVDAVQEEVRNDVLALIGVGLVALLLGVGVAWVLAGFLARPPRKLAETARRVSAGDLEARASESGPREERELAAAFNEMTARLAASLEAQREFVANASHQLRTPLTGLRLRVEAAALKADDPGLSSEFDAAEREAERLARLVTSLLALAREGDRPGAPRPVSLADAARAAVERWESQGQVVAHGEDDVFAAASDEDVAIVLDNLVENALRYAPPSSEVAIGWRREGERAVLLVDDEGPGLTPGEEVEVFERFARGSAGRGVSGSSLGLPIVATLARRWEGAASLRNRPGGGDSGRGRGRGRGSDTRAAQARARTVREAAASATTAEATTSGVTSLSGGATLACVPSKARAELVDGSGAGWSWPQRLPGPRFTLPL